VRCPPIPIEVVVPTRQHWTKRLTSSVFVLTDCGCCSSQFSWVSTASARTSRRQLSPLGKMRTTWVRRLISSFKRSSMLVTGMKIAVPARSAGTGLVPAYGATIRDEGHREHASGQADVFDEPRARVSSWPPLRPTRLRRERGSVVVVSPTAPIGCNEEGS
jgi:hypothetical protein